MKCSLINYYTYVIQANTIYIDRASLEADLSCLKVGHNAENHRRTRILGSERLCFQEDTIFMVRKPYNTV